MYSSIDNRDMDWKRYLQMYCVTSLPVVLSTFRRWLICKTASHSRVESTVTFNKFETLECA